MAQGINLSNVEIIDFTDSGLEKNWVVIAIANDDWCALIAEEVRSDRYSGFFTTNRNLTNRYLNIIKEALNIEIEIWKVCIISIWIIRKRLILENNWISIFFNTNKYN